MPVHDTSQQTPSTQTPLAQSALELQACPFFFLQPPLPSHAFPASQLPGTSVPGRAGLHVPSEPGTAHDWHAPLQAATSQQTSSTQKPLAQDDGELALQPSPLPRLVTLYSQVSLIGMPVLML